MYLLQYCPCLFVGERRSQQVCRICMVQITSSAIWGTLIVMLMLTILITLGWSNWWLLILFMFQIKITSLGLEMIMYVQMKKLNSWTSFLDKIWSLKRMCDICMRIFLISNTETISQVHWPWWVWGGIPRMCNGYPRSRNWSNSSSCEGKCINS